MLSKEVIDQIMSSRTIIDLIWLIFISGLFIYFLREYFTLKSYKNWSKTKAQVIKIQWHHHKNILWPKVEYLYHVGGYEYIGEHLFPDTFHNAPTSKYSRQIAYNTAKAYKDYKEIEIFFNPEQPEQSAIDVKIPRKVIFILFFLGFLIALHITIFLFRINIFH